MDAVQTVQTLPAKQPLHSFFTSQESSMGVSSNNDDAPDNEEFSMLSWNILLPNSKDNWWNHKMYSKWVPMDKRKWSHRQTLIRERMLLSGADIVCIQEADGDTFEDDFAFMKEAGYGHCLHKKFRFRCATFFKRDKFVLERDAHKDRTLVTVLRSGNRVLNVVNCHLSGGAAPQRRLNQVYEALEQIRKWKTMVATALEKQRNANRPSPKNIDKAQEALRLQENAGVIVCGDFNSDGDTGVRRLLVEGSIDPHWRESQYPSVPLTSRRKEQGHFLSTRRN
jgi:mRNA deadenylase 3'-5' endonuclease subunit Ccr4